MRRQIILVVILVGALSFYFYPSPRYQIKELYAGGERGKILALDSVRALPLKTINVGSVPWKYLVAGRGSNCVLFLHGMAGSYDIWWQQIHALKNDYKIITLTYPVVGSLREMGEGVVKILDAENIVQTHVIGSSLGGYFAQYLKANYPGRFEKAIFANTFPPNDIYKEKNASLAAVARFLPEWLLMAAFRDNVRKVVLPASESSPLVEAYLLQQSYGGMSKEQFLARYQCVIDKFAPLPSLNTSKDILIIESDNDPLVFPELRERMKEVYPAAEVVTFHDKGHFPYMNETERYNTVLKEFLARP